MHPRRRATLANWPPPFWGHKEVGKTQKLDRIKKQVSTDCGTRQGSGHLAAFQPPHRFSVALELLGMISHGVELVCNVSCTLLSNPLQIKSAFIDHLLPVSSPLDFVRAKCSQLKLQNPKGFQNVCVCTSCRTLLNLGGCGSLR